MKKKLILWSFALAAAFGAWANPVDVNQARRVGAAYLTVVGHRIVENLEEVKTPFGEFYVFNASNGGFVLVAADDCVRPILGYSQTGEFRVDQMPTNVQGWLEDYERGIAAVKQAVKEEARGPQHGGSLTEAVAREWQQLYVAVPPESSLPTAVAPLLTTTWNQSPLYNNMCPYDSDYGKYVVAGCVAISTAQIMKYWNHPAMGYGSHSYLAQNDYTSYGVQSANFGNTSYAWNLMPNALTSVSSQAEINAVAQLVYHVGVAIEMNYSANASGAQDYSWDGTPRPSSQYALIEYFKYAPDMSVVQRSDYSDAAFSAILRAELDQQRPILFEGSSTSAGHSFVCDGYDQQNNFHINWGWGGYCDGYYTIGALNPAPGGTGGNSTSSYNLNNAVVIGIRPNTSFGSGGTVTVSTTGGNSSCTVTGGGTYSFGDTVTLSASAGTGYRFVGWSDNSTFNPRTILMTGGNTSLTARFETIGGDTMSYSGNMGQYTSWGEYQQGFDKYWGIKLPASSLTPGRTLTAVDFYVGSYYGGYYDLTVYSGTTGPTDTVYSTSVWVEYSDCNDWFSLFLPTPYTVEANKSIWITFHNSDILFPATVSHSCGNPDGFLYGPQFNPDPEWNQFTFMIRGRFVNPGIIAQGDTISYCGNKQYYSGWGLNEWGMMIPASELAGRNYLQAVKLFADNSGIYTLRVYKGGTSSPTNLVHTQPVEINEYGWQEVALDALVTLNTTDNLWITFSCPDAPWPAASCRYTGNPNSSWIKLIDGSWMHLSDYFQGSDYSWMIKAVTSATAPTLPPPTVAIKGDRYVGVNSQATFVAAHTTGTTVTWNIQDVTPSTYTGDTVTVNWSQTGWHQITASVSNSHGIGGDELWVNVVDCDQAVTDYPYYLSFETTDNMVCVTTLDADNDGYGWWSVNSSYNGMQSFFSESSTWTGSGYQSIAVDDWMFLPKMTTRQGANYSLQWYDMVEWLEQPLQAHYGIYIDTTAGTNTANYILLAEHTANDNWWQLQSLDLSAYAGKTFRLAFRHYNNGGPNGLYIDDITVNEDIPFFREGDTISYCGFRPWQSQLGYTSGTTRWGVKFPSSRLANCDTLKSVLLYVIEDANYTLNLWQGGDIAPATLIRSVDTTFSNQFGWQEFVLNSSVAIDGSQPLWVTFVSNGGHPAAYAQYSGDANSDWLSDDGVNWAHSIDYNYPASWMIKAVASATAGCSGITLPYEADFTQCWQATGGATVIDSNQASLTAQGQKLTSPWFETLPGKTFLLWNTSINNDLWNESSNYSITIEGENGVIEYFDNYSCNSSSNYYFTSPGGRVRVVFERIGSEPTPTFRLSDVVLFRYPIELSIDAPTTARIGDTVTITAIASLPNGDTVDYWYWGNLYKDGQWMGQWEDSISALTLIASTNNSRTIVLHDEGLYEFSVQITKANAFGVHYAYADEWKSFNVFDTTMVDCNNISLPYTADFTQCWTAENGATIIDPGHAAIISNGQKITSPWMQSVPGKTFFFYAMDREGSGDWDNERVIYTVESENGVIIIWSNTPWNGTDLQYFDSPGGRIRVSMEYIGNNPLPSLQFHDVRLYQYQIDLALDMPSMAHVGDTVTITAHATLQNGETIDDYYWSMYDANWNWMDDNNPDRTIISRTDTSMTMVWNTAGWYQVGVDAYKWDVYQGDYAYAHEGGNINVVDYSFYEEDSIYYASVARDTVVGCHSHLHTANLPASVRVIRDSAFFDRPYLSGVTLPDGLAYIGKMAFALNYQLREITIPRDVRIIGDNAFWSCGNLEVVNFNAINCLTASPTTDNNGNYWPVFYGCNNVTTIHIGENVTRIPDRLFSYCTALRDTLVIPDQVTYIGANAFYSWVEDGPELTLVLGRSVTTIGNYAFPGYYGRVHHVISLNPVPPTLQSASFYTQHNYSLVTVPCGSREAYLNSNYWDEFIIEENCDGIEDITTDDVVVYTVEGGIVVEEAQIEPVAVYDVMGRKIASAFSDGTLIRISQTGVYMVRIGDRPARKVVVLK